MDIVPPVPRQEQHVAGLEREETAGERYLVSSTDQYSTLEFAQMASAGGAGGVDMAAWAADEDAQKMAPKKPSTNNAKVSAGPRPILRMLRTVSSKSGVGC